MTPSASDTDVWVLRPRRRPDAKLRLFCFPHAGGSGAAFREWADALPEEIELCCIQPPGRASRFAQAPFRRLLPLADAAAAAIAPLLDRPYALFGHSLGARVAFETARVHCRSGIPAPKCLFVSASRAPHVDQRRPIHGLPDAELIRELQKFGGLPREVLDVPELLQLLLPTLRADLEAYETYEYQPGPPLEVPIHALSGAADDTVPLHSIEAWGAHGAAGFQMSVFPGGHFYLHAERTAVLAVVARRLLS